jgi:hypothetical protein
MKQIDMTPTSRTRKRFSWFLVTMAVAVIFVSLHFWSYPISAMQSIANATVLGLRSWDDLTIHLKLLAPYLAFSIALKFARDENIVNWALGVAAGLFCATTGTCYHAFVYQTEFWIDYIVIFQSAVAVLFLFEGIRQRLRDGARASRPERVSSRA